MKVARLDRIIVPIRGMLALLCLLGGGCSTHQQQQQRAPEQPQMVITLTEERREQFKNEIQAIQRDLGRDYDTAKTDVERRAAEQRFDERIRMAVERLRSQSGDPVGQACACRAPKYQIAAAGTKVFRLDTQTGNVVWFDSAAWVEYWIQVPDDVKQLKDLRGR